MFLILALVPCPSLFTYKVVFNGHLRSLRDVVSDRRKTMPVVKFAYHKFVEAPTPGQPDAFKLEVVKRVCFSPGSSGKVDTEEGENGGDSNPTTGQAAAARMLPINVWKPEVCQLVFSVKWTAAGLMPIRPQIMLLADAVMPAGTCAGLSD